MSRILVLVLAISVSACAAVGPMAYGPADKNGFGYEETRVESDRYRVVYRGSGGMPLEQVEDYALLRSAELALAGGYDWFRIVGRDVTGEQRGGVGVGAGFGTGSYGRRSGVSVGAGGDLGTIGGRDYFTVRMEVLMGSGEPLEDGQYYDAREVQETIGARAGG